MVEQTVSLALIIEWLNEYSGALTVIITLVYVVATIFICRANIKSVEETRKQIAEMKREFDEGNRPIVEAEFLLARRLIYVLRFSNHGRKTAQHVKINLEQEFIDSLQKGVFKNQLQKQQRKECIIGVDQHYDLHIGDFRLRANSNLKPITGTISYESNGCTYTSDLYIDIENYMTFFSTNTDHDDLIEAIKDNTAVLKEISDSINCSQDEEMSDDNA